MALHFQDSTQFTFNKLTGTKQKKMENDKKSPPSSSVGMATSRGADNIYKLSDFKLGVTLGTGSFGRVRFAKFKNYNGKFRPKKCKQIAETSANFIEEETRDDDDDDERNYEITYDDDADQHDEEPCFAIKMLKKTKVLELNQVEHTINEKDILYEISKDQHPFIVKFWASFQDDKFLYMVLSFINGGEVYTHLRALGNFDPHVTRFYSASVVSIFEYLHKKDIVYRDLKPENLLLDNKGFLKLTDFGFAKKVLLKTYTLCGTPEYLAPEVLLNQGHGKSVDYWTLGILTYEMLLGQPPFMAEQPLEIYKLIVKCRPKFPEYVNKGAKSYIKHLLQADLARRYGCLENGIDDIKNHRFLKDIDFDKLRNMEITPPLLPSTDDAADTGNYESYPDTPNAAVSYKPSNPHDDPFIGFDCTV